MELTKLKPILDGIEQRFANRDVVFSIKCDPALLVRADSERLSEVFDELAANSLRWLGGNNKRVTIDASASEGAILPQILDPTKQYILIQFADSGPGVELDSKDKIFDAFYTTHDHGTGLGLALVRRIIEGHGGVVRECGAPGAGAIFEIYLPRPEESTADGARVIETQIN